MNLKKQTIMAFVVLLLIYGISFIIRPTTSEAAQKAEYQLKLMVISRNIAQFKVWEEYINAIQERTSGRVKFEITSLPELGIGGAEAVRLIKTRMVDIAVVYAGYVAGELPLLEIVAIPGIFPNKATAKKGLDAWKPVETEVLLEKANAILLGRAKLTDQVFFSNKPIRNLKDFKGLKIRSHSVALAQLVKGLGAEPVNLPYAEVYTAMERGTVDASISDTRGAHNMRWYEIAKYMAGPLFNRAPLILAINKNAWDKLPIEVQQVMQEEGDRIIEKKSYELADKIHQEGIEKNVKAGMEYIPFSSEIQETVQNIVRTKIVPDWSKRAGGEKAVNQFNQRLAPVLGYKIGF